jgi:hypothetical protein
MKLGFHSKVDQSKEPINRGEFESKSQAVEYFAKLKNLSIDDFLLLFNVIKIKK